MKILFERQFTDKGSRLNLAAFMDTRSEKSEPGILLYGIHKKLLRTFPSPHPTPPLNRESMSL
jgi:hypothetical protein